MQKILLCGIKFQFRKVTTIKGGAPYRSIALLGCSRISEQKEAHSSPSDGELTSTFTQTPSAPQSPAAEPVKTEEDLLIEQGWSHTTLNNGILPECYNYEPKMGELNNRLEVNVGGGTDVAIKVMSQTTGKCVRYVYINSGSAYSIQNIPEDKYYLKIAYGKNWMSKIESGQCTGKFLTNALYKRRKRFWTLIGLLV